MMFSSKSQAHQQVFEKLYMQNCSLNFKILSAALILKDYLDRTMLLQ